MMKQGKSVFLINLITQYQGSTKYKKTHKFLHIYSDKIFGTLKKVCFY